MSLIIYREGQVPKDVKYVRNNDAYFDLNTPLTNTDACKHIIKSIDKAEYHSSDMFIGRDKGKGALYASYLSTGSKTALNVLNHPDICFSLIECGNNARNIIFSLKDGMVEWDGYILYTDLLGDIDIILDGIPFTDEIDLSRYLQESR